MKTKQWKVAKVQTNYDEKPSEGIGNSVGVEDHMFVSNGRWYEMAKGGWGKLIINMGAFMY